MAFLDPVFNPVFLPLLNKSPFLGILVFSLLITFIVTIAYKYLSNQVEMKRLKEAQKDFQDKMKAVRDKPEEMMKIQKEAMATNFEYMKHSLKPTLFTMIPILIIFGWMAGHMAFEPIFPHESYSVTGVFKEGITGKVMIVVDDKTEVLNGVEQEIKGKEAIWSLRSATEGEHTITIKQADVVQSKMILVSTRLETADAFTLFDHSDIEQIKINYNKLRPLGNTFNLFGWYPGWLAWYIVFSIGFSIGLRKVMNVY